MLVSVETAWLFTRGPESVRIVRATSRGGLLHLLVQGPGAAAEQQQFTDVVDCMNYQADLERRLVSDGYVLERFTSDRRLQDRRTRVGGARRIRQLFL